MEETEEKRGSKLDPLTEMLALEDAQLLVMTIRVDAWSGNSNPALHDKMCRIGNWLGERQRELLELVQGGQENG